MANRYVAAEGPIENAYFSPVSSSVLKRARSAVSAEDLPFGQPAQFRQRVSLVSCQQGVFYTRVSSAGVFGQDVEGHSQSVRWVEHSVVIHTA